MSYEKYNGVDVEVISQPLWDTVSVAAATATTQATFFQIPRGGAAGKTLEDTNMVLAGQLPRPQMAHIKSLSFFVKQTTADAAGLLREDVQEIMDGTLAFVVGAKTILEVPLHWLVAGFGLVVQQATQAAAADGYYQTNGLPGHPYKWFLKHRILIEQGENFRCDLVWETAFNSADAVDLVLIADSEIMRAVQ